jgi:hypothetical protein
MYCSCYSNTECYSHPLDGLHDSLEPNGVEIQIKILDHPIIERPSIVRF